MIQKNALTKLLRVLASTIDNLDEADIDLLLSGKGRLIYTPFDKQKNTQSELVMDHDALMDKLNNCKDREEARQVLSSVTNKDTLASLAKSQKLYVAKHDRREDIENKIIEFVIGAKLRTEAIQTLNLKGGGSENS